MPVQPPTRFPSRPGAETDPDTLDALVSSSRVLGRFWPPIASGPQPAAAPSTGVSVPSGAQSLVASMAEYGG